MSKYLDDAATANITGMATGLVWEQINKNGRRFVWFVTLSHAGERFVERVELKQTEVVYGPVGDMLERVAYRKDCKVGDLLVLSVSAHPDY